MSIIAIARSTSAAAVLRPVPSLSPHTRPTPTSTAKAALLILSQTGKLRIVRHVRLRKVQVTYLHFDSTAARSTIQLITRLAVKSCITFPDCENKHADR